MSAGAATGPGIREREAVANITRRLGICMVIQSYYPHIGGAERQLQALTAPLRRRGIDVTVVTRGRPGLASRAVLRGTRIQRTFVGGGRAARSLGFTVGALLFMAGRRRCVDIVHAHDLLSPATTAVLAKVLLRRPVVVKVLRGGQLGDLAVRCAGVPGSRLVRIPNGVDTDWFRPATVNRRAALREELGLAGRKVAVFVGRIEPEKGILTLLEAWPTVRRALPDALLLLAGDGSERPVLQARCVEEARFVGPVDEPVTLLQAADCFVLPSYTEGLSNALLEAMATGLPCVATSIGGNVELIRGDAEGWLVRPDDSSALAQALIDALRGECRETVGCAARSRAVREFSLERTADLLSGLYWRLASRDSLA